MPGENRKNKKESLKCSFCGKTQNQVRKLIAGPGVYVCNECIDLCNEIINEETREEKELGFKDLPRPKKIYEILDDIIDADFKAEDDK